MLRVGIIGSGFGLYGLLPAFRLVKNCQVVSICGRKTDRLVNYCKEIGLKKIYTDWQQMLNEEKLDAIAIAVTPNAQYQIAKTAINKGINIFAEKPLAANYEQVKELFNLVKKRGVQNAVDFIFPEIKEWQKVKKLIDAKKLGDLKKISANWDFLSYDIKNNITSWKTDINQGGGALSFYFSHTLYYLEYFAGKITDIKSTFTYSKKSRNGAEVGVDLLLKLGKNVTGNAHINCNSPILNKHKLVFECEMGTIVLENEDNITRGFIIKIKRGNNKEEIIMPKEKTVVDEDQRVQVVKTIATRFVDCCIRNKDFKPSFKEGLRVQELIEKIRNQTPLTFESNDTC